MPNSHLELTKKCLGNLRSLQISSPLLPSNATEDFSYKEAKPACRCLEDVAKRHSLMRGTLFD